MSDIYQSLSHSRWNCKYHIVFVPRRRCKVLFDQVRPHLEEIFHALARQGVASVIGFVKGKSAISVARQLCGKERNFAGEHFWASGYVVSTVGFELEQVRQYIRDQESADGTEGRM